VGRQRTISRFSLICLGDSRLASLTRHWYLDWDGPRPERLTLAATEAVVRDREAALARRPTPEVSEVSEVEPALRDSDGPAVPDGNESMETGERRSQV
jgi:hypothetical protein